MTNTITNYVDNYVVIKEWARKDDRPFKARNLYRVTRETAKAVYIFPVDYFYNSTPDGFWCAKSAVTDIIDSHGHIDD